ncbi:hypothetical protein MRB56_12840 [Halomonas cupida]|uniref:hypothetical protein n=1 Tax=Halomonas cupida TaxID=44933 RepID=UPI0039B6C915
MIMVRHPARPHTQFVDVRFLAEAWQEHAVTQVTVDPNTQLTAVPALSTNLEAGYRPAFYVPENNVLVVVLTAFPHRTFESAKQCLIDLLEAMHQTGAITLEISASTVENAA